MPKSATTRGRVRHEDYHYGFLSCQARVPGWAIGMPDPAAEVEHRALIRQGQEESAKPVPFHEEAAAILIPLAGMPFIERDDRVGA